MGIGRGGLQRLASMPMSLDDRYKQAQIDNIYSEINKRNTEGAAGYDPSEIIAYAQQYASTGAIPTGLPKGSFGIIAQVAKELPKPKGTVVNTTTGITDSKIPSTEQTDYSRLVNIVNNTKRLAELDEERWGGLVSGIAGKITGSESQTKYLAIRKAIIDDMQRMQSGAALTEKETAFYADYLPGRYSNTLGFGAPSGNKIANFQEIIDNRLKERLAANGLSIYGYSTVNVGDDSFVVGDLIQNSSGQVGRVNPDGSITIVE
jgi:hypothetical protein